MIKFENLFIFFIICLASLLEKNLSGQIKETFSKQERNQLLRMATFGPTAQMVANVDEAFSISTELTIWLLRM